MFFPNPSDITLSSLQLLKESGYAYVELPLAESLLLNIEQAAILKKFIQDTHLPCEGFNNFFPASFRLTGEDASLDAAVEYADKALSFASSFGASVVVFGSGGARNVPFGFSMDKAYDQIAAVLYRIGNIAKQHNINICIEHLRRQESNILNAYTEVFNLAKYVNHPSICCLVDFFHQAIENESPNVIDDICDPGFLRHVHFANPAGRVFPSLDDQETDQYVEFFNTLRRINYSGRISCEAYSNDLVSDAPATIRLFEKYLN